MAYTRIRIDLTKGDFPFLTTLSGRTVFAAGIEENKQGLSNDNTVGMLFCENVIPIKEGLQSVDYFEIVPPLDIPDGSYLTLLPYSYNQLTGNYNSLANYTLAKPYSQYGLRFQRILEVRSSNTLRAYIAVTQIGQLFIVNEAIPEWHQINNDGWIPELGDVDNVTVATLLVNGTTETYICLPNHGIFKVNVSARTLTRVTFRSGSDINQANIKGICASYNYLVLHDGNQLQWSSAVDPLDFNLANAQITGTGFGTPVGLQGTIVALISNPSGYTVYSNVNSINVEYSANTLFPWVFTPIANSAGIISARDVAVGQDNINYVITTQGLHAVNQRNAMPVFPEFTDFLALNAIETYDHSTNKIIVIGSGTNKLIYDISYLGSRWVLLSYGIETGLYREYTHAFIYDTALKRWGKLVINHVDAVDYRIGQFNDIKKGLALMQIDGTVVGIDVQAVECPCAAGILNQGNYTISPCFPGVWVNDDDVQTGGSILVLMSNPIGSFNGNPLGVSSFTEVEVVFNSNQERNAKVTVAITTVAGSYSKEVFFTTDALNVETRVRFIGIPSTVALSTTVGVAITLADFAVVPTMILAKEVYLIGPCGETFG